LYRWNRSAGCRSLFALPKISDTYSHQRLQKSLDIEINAPKTLQEQWQLFVQIYRANFDKSSCNCEVLYFSKQWILDIKNNPKWHELHLYLLSEAWTKSSFWRNEVAFRLVYNNFLNQLSAKGIKTKPRILAVVKHLILIRLGLLPGFCSANMNYKHPLTYYRNLILIYII
jgi:hypothetical protein